MLVMKDWSGVDSPLFSSSPPHFPLITTAKYRPLLEYRKLSPNEATLSWPSCLLHPLFTPIFLSVARSIRFIVAAFEVGTAERATNHEFTTTVKVQFGKHESCSINRSKLLTVSSSYGFRGSQPLPPALRSWLLDRTPQSALPKPPRPPQLS
ncbi:hypothetical protein BJ508DRAFT_19714 [Ascobolus immersus RN42]|uniref:Uncharacterized protein n=1 Tax=Ascobolus immersus RN42 TaxID=1160509 RepID=A0A3N4IHI7_ASCIM|nr:hypothetical protein BJ508DRAFT_19714 [Ascobolus immersus RN42]